MASDPAPTEDAATPPDLQARRGDPSAGARFEIADLQSSSMTALLETARCEGVEIVPGLSKQELIYEILTQRADRSEAAGRGVLDILPDGFGFLRVPGYDYVAGPDDIYVSPSQVRRLNLKQGHTLTGPVRPPKRGEKYFALLRVDTVDGAPVEHLARRISFAARTPLGPTDAIGLDGPGIPTTARVLDLLAPIGLGQRVLISAPPRSGKTELIAEWTSALLAAREDIYAILCLVDERPEDVTEIRAAVTPTDRREVVASTFDNPTQRHVALAEMCLAKARRQVEAGRHVLLVLDSLTNLVRAYNKELPHTGKILTPGLDSGALLRPKALFGSARDTAEGGSLTVIATVATHTDSPIDRAIAEEFANKANCEISLAPHLVELRLEPPVDPHRSSTRNEPTLLSEPVLEGTRHLRRKLAELEPAAALEALLSAINETPDNRTLLAQQGE